VGQLPDRRCEAGRRRADREIPVALRGLLHDVGRDLAALSYLVELVRGDSDLNEVNRHRVELIARELDRLTELVQEKAMKAPEPEVLPVRPMLEQIISLITTPNGTQVRLLAGEDLFMRIDGASLWRMVANLLDNAVRAAGRHGQVEVTARGGPDVLIEVADDGPGFGHAPGGSASLGLGIVTGLAKACGGSLRMQRAEPLGTRAQLLFPGAGVDAATPVSASGER
jgi:signal transduction histidine kinase